MLLTVAMLCGLLLLAGCDDRLTITGAGVDISSGSKPAVVAGDVNTVSFNVPGMTCAGCVAMVEETLTGAAGIEKCSVDLEHKIATCKIDPDKFKADAVLQALADAGYKDSTLKN